jgi:hypothetical protein
LVLLSPKSNEQPSSKNQEFQAMSLTAEDRDHVKDIRRWAEAHWREPRFTMDRSSVTPATIVWLCDNLLGPTTLEAAIQEAERTRLASCGGLPQ